MTVKNKGQFSKGTSGNPAGRPRSQGPDADSPILKAMNETVVVNHNGTRKTMKKADAVATQIVNKGAAGDLRAAKMAMDFTHKAQDRSESANGTGGALSVSDQEIASRILERLARLVLNHPGKFLTPGLLKPEGEGHE